MEIRLPHEVTYDFDGRASVDEVARSLLAQERLVHDAVSIIAGCFPGLEISETKVEFVSVSQESPLKEILAAAVLLAFQDDLETEVPDLIQKLTGADIPDQYDTLVTVFVMIAAIYGASYLYDRFSKKGTATALPNEKAALINVAGDYFNIHPDTVRDSADTYFSKGRLQTAAKAAGDFFAPAKRHNARAIRSSREFEIGEAAIREFPSDIDISSFERETDSYLMEDVVIEFQAHDTSAGGQQ